MALPITLSAAPGRWRIRLGDLILGETAAALRLEEAGHDPVLYVPRADIDMSRLTRSPHHSTCPWKGQASYFSVAGQDNVIWSYETPIPAMAGIAGHLAFYPAITVEPLV